MFDEFDDNDPSGEDFFNNVFHNHIRRFGKSSNRYNNNSKSQDKKGGGGV
jgi:hypothetical protein